MRNSGQSDKLILSATAAYQYHQYTYSAAYPTYPALANILVDAKHLA